MSSRNFVTTDGEGDIPMLIQGAVSHKESMISPIINDER